LFLTHIQGCSHDSLEPHLEDEIAILAGDILNVHTIFDDGWAAGQNKRTGAVGIFPLPCCVQANETYDPSAMGSDADSVISKRHSSFSYKP
jgi:hypothetical protein